MHTAALILAEALKPGIALQWLNVHREARDAWGAAGTDSIAHPGTRRHLTRGHRKQPSRPSQATALRPKDRDKPV